MVVIGGGWAGCAAAEQFADAGLKVCVVSEGLSLTIPDLQKPYERIARLQKNGVTVLRGDRALRGTIEDDRVTGVITRNLGENTPLTADKYVLATGKFFSRGLLSDKDHIWEPVFGADVEYDADRSRWFNPDFGARQPFMKFGVKTDSEHRVMVGGRAIVNLLAVGDICNE